MEWVVIHIDHVYNNARWTQPHPRRKNFHRLWMKTDEILFDLKKSSAGLCRYTTSQAVLIGHCFGWYQTMSLHVNRQCEEEHGQMHDSLYIRLLAFYRLQLQVLDACSKLVPSAWWRVYTTLFQGRARVRYSAPARRAFHITKVEMWALECSSEEQCNARPFIVQLHVKSTRSGGRW